MRPCAGAQRGIRTVRLPGTNEAPNGHRRKTIKRSGFLSMAGFYGRAIMEKKRSIILRKRFPCIKNKKPIMPWRGPAIIAPGCTSFLGIIPKRENSLKRPLHGATNHKSDSTAGALHARRQQYASVRKTSLPAPGSTNGRLKAHPKELYSLLKKKSWNAARICFRRNLY